MPSHSQAVPGGGPSTPRLLHGHRARRRALAAGLPADRRRPTASKPDWSSSVAPTRAVGTGPTTTPSSPPTWRTADLAEQEGRVERFFINLALVRVLYAHALVAAPRLALGPFAPSRRTRRPAARHDGDLPVAVPRPAGDLSGRRRRAQLRGRRASFGHLVDVGVIQPRVDRLYNWSADELGIPALRDLLSDGVPTYAWGHPGDDPAGDLWRPRPSRTARLARAVVR